MEYLILEDIYEGSSFTLIEKKIIGEGFQSLNAVWMAIYQEVQKRIINGSPRIDFSVILKIKSGGQDLEVKVGFLHLDNDVEGLKRDLLLIAMKKTS